MIENCLRAAILPDLNLQPGELYLARSPAILADHSRIVRGRHVLERAAGRGRSVPWRAAPMSRKFGLPDSSVSDGYRYVDFSIRYLAQQFDALRARTGGTGSEIVRRRRCAPVC